MSQTALMIMVLVVGGLAYMRSRAIFEPQQGREEPLIPAKAYAALLGAGLVVALLLH